jgi:hypothetical protein
MSPRLFISQEKLDAMTATGRVVLDGLMLVFPHGGATLLLESGVYVAQAVDGADPHDLVGRVQTDEQLVSLGAERMGGSLLVGEVGYDCVEGFTAAATDESLDLKTLRGLVA